MTRTRRQRGTVYIAILGLSILVAVIGLGGIALSRAQGRARDLQADTDEARGYAMDAVELARTLINADANWRTDYSNGNWFTNQSWGNGSFTLNVTDPAGALNNADTDPVTVTGTGMKGQAVQRIQVTLVPVLTPYSCMYAALCTGGLLSLNNTTVIGAGALISSNTSITTGNATVYPSAESAGAVLGSTFYANVTSLATPRTLPPSNVFDYYNANGTTIAYSSLPSGGTLQNCLLSPTSNPYGATNAKGIYIINCNLQNLTINNCRIVGTLVILNANNITIQGNINWEPAVANLPCLLMQGSVTMKASNGTLNEGGSIPNLNPASTPYPYPNGAGNSTTSDSYPSVIDGLVYVSGNLVIQNNPSVDNLLVTGTLNASGILSLNPQPILLSNPPPGFRTVNMGVSPGTWKQQVN
ncbi:MAG TPA: hypothetical protein VHQ47_06680 [Phycisphaerae bacterium]|nr:hypothetical protein [Phycisphaerae bacterium]